MIVYGLSDPRTGVIRYVGRTRNLRTRINGHLHCHDPGRAADARRAWIAELSSVGLRPDVIVLAECTERDCEEAESRWIATHAGPGLLNRHTRSRYHAPGSDSLPGTPVCVRMNHAEMAAVRAEANRIGITVSELVRGLLLKAGIISVDMVPEPEPEAAKADSGAIHGKGRGGK